MSTFSSPATSTFFIDPPSYPPPRRGEGGPGHARLRAFIGPSVAAVDGEAPDHAVDDAIRGGGVGVEALVQAAEEREELADHHVEEHQVLVGEAVAAFHDHVLRPRGH